MASKNVFTTLLTGHKMPLLGIGTWQAELQQVKNAVKVAIETGYRHVDCAYDYANEDAVGEAIKEKIDDGTIKREDLFVTSKLWCTYHHPDDVEEGIRETLRDLQLDYVDLYLIHWPMAFPKSKERYPEGPDGRGAVSDVPLTDTWKGMEKLADKGLAKSIGVSNLNMSQFKEIFEMERRHPIAMHQIEIHPYLNQDEMINFCRSQNIAVTAYCPLGSGDAGLLQDPVVANIAKKKGKSLAQILLRYHVQQGIVCIPKSVTPSRIQENFECLNFELTEGEVSELKALNKNKRFCTYPEMYHHPLHPFPQQ